MTVCNRVHNSTLIAFLKVNLDSKRILYLQAGVAPSTGDLASSEFV